MISHLCIYKPITIPRKISTSKPVAIFYPVPVVDEDIQLKTTDKSAHSIASPLSWSGLLFRDPRDAFFEGAAHVTPSQWHSATPAPTKRLLRHETRQESVSRKPKQRIGPISAGWLWMEGEKQNFCSWCQSSRHLPGRRISQAEA